MYDRISGSVANLLAAYSFENTTSASGGVIDRSENGVNGTLAGATLPSMSSATPTRMSGLLEGDTITLDVDATDPEHTNLTYTWTQQSGPTLTTNAAYDAIGTVASFDFENSTAGVSSYSGGTFQMERNYVRIAIRPKRFACHYRCDNWRWRHLRRCQCIDPTGEYEAGHSYRISYWARTVDTPMTIAFSNQNGSGDQNNLSHSNAITTTWQLYERIVTLDVAKHTLYIWGSTTPSSGFVSTISVSRKWTKAQYHLSLQISWPILRSRLP